MNFTFQVVGVTDLLMHGVNIEADDEIEEMRRSAKSKSTSVAGDDRTNPTWKWMTYLYLDNDGDIALPVENFRGMLRDAGAKVILKGKTTFKSLAATSFLFPVTHCKLHLADVPVTIDTVGKAKLNRVNSSAIHAMRDETFIDQLKGFESLTGGAATVDLRPVRVNNKMHKRTRPRFKAGRWVLQGEGLATDDALTEERAQEIFSVGGKLVGLGDFRPYGKGIQPGVYGQFDAVVKRVK